MLDSPLRRRLVTIPTVLVLVIATTLLSPLLILVALGTDLIRRLSKRSPFMAIRIIGFGWVYLLGEAWALASLAFAGLWGNRRSVKMTFALQKAWTAWNFRALQVFFRATGVRSR